MTRILLVGYGRMGKLVESLAGEYGCEIAGIVDPLVGKDGVDSDRWKCVPAIDVSSTRAGYIPGTHTIGFDGPAETITLTHTARDRSAFARGALMAAQWIKGRKGWFTMREVLGL